MSIYATLWRMKFPKEGDEHLGCEWIESLLKQFHRTSLRQAPAADTKNVILTPHFFRRR